MSLPGYHAWYVDGDPDHFINEVIFLQRTREVFGDDPRSNSGVKQPLRRHVYLWRDGNIWDDIIKILTRMGSSHCSLCIVETIKTQLTALSNRLKIMCSRLWVRYLAISQLATSHTCRVWAMKSCKCFSQSAGMHDQQKPSILIDAHLNDLPCLTFAGLLPTRKARPCTSVPCWLFNINLPLNTKYHPSLANFCTPLMLTCYHSDINTLMDCAVTQTICNKFLRAVQATIVGVISSNPFDF